MSYYFEDFEVDQVFESPRRTITSADIMIFAGFSGDYNPLHTDEEFCKTTQFGTRILHGPAGFAIASGLESRIGIKDGTLLKFLKMNWNLKAPIVAGDTIHLVEKVVSKSAPPDEQAGIVDFQIEVLNQRKEICQEGFWSFLIKRKGDV